MIKQIVLWIAIMCFTRANVLSWAIGTRSDTNAYNRAMFYCLSVANKFSLLFHTMLDINSTSHLPGSRYLQRKYFKINWTQYEWIKRLDTWFCKYCFTSVRALWSNCYRREWLSKNQETLQKVNRTDNWILLVQVLPATRRKPNPCC